MTGSLQEKNGRYYMVLSTMKDGKQHLQWKSTGLTVKGNKHRAQEMLKAFLREQEEQAKAQPQGDIFMSDLIREWLKTKKREIRSNTYTSYEDTATIHVIPYFEGYTAVQLTTAHIKQYYNTKFEAGIKPESLARHRTILRGALDYAIETLDIISVNVADRAKLPKKQQEAHTDVLRCGTN